jgi:NADH dehydrogenase
MVVGRLQALMMELAPGEPLMSRDNLDAMSVDNVATGQWPGLRDLGIRPAAVAAVAPTYLGGHNSRSRLLALRRGLNSTAFRPLKNRRGLATPAADRQAW